MKQIVPEIYVRSCRQALDYYQRIFGGEIKNLQLSEDVELFRHLKNKVIHSELHINSHCVCYFVDIFEEKRSQTGNVTLVLHLESPKKLQAVFSGLADGGKVGMPPQKTFWGAWHAIVTDRFGAPWALSCPADEKETQ